MRSPLRPDPAHPFQLVKFLSWSSLVLILSTSVFISVVIANYAKQTVMQKHQEFALLLAENLNHQIFQRFTLPTVLGMGRITLKEEAQYERLNQVVLSTIHSFHVLELHIFDEDGMVAYSLDKDMVGREDLAGKSFQAAMKKGGARFDQFSRASFWKSLFGFNLEPGSYVLQTTYVLRAERSLDPDRLPGPVMGVLQFSQDITQDYETIITFQWSVVVVALFSSLLLFLFLFMIIRRADSIVAERFSEKERLERELHQNERLASMGRMVASIAHEIRNPLGIIRSSAELLHKKARKENDPNQRLLKAIHDESKRLSRTVNDFLDYARPRQPKKDAVDLNRTLENVCVFLEQELQLGEVKVERRMPEKLTVQGDKDLLYRVFYNLMVNAIQAVQGPGTIIVAGSEGPDAVEVSISDTGPGFDPDLLDKYLEPFYTRKETGTGLGLAIVRNIVESHGGSVQLGSADGRGAKVRLIFPKAPERNRTPSRKA
ncbi:MAG: sensor histidine kinase [Desulfohalobiaceae bacterium]